jgi:hypothetical protein
MKNNQKGTITPALLIIASAFIIALYGLLFILALQFDFSQRQVASDKALHIAEAGINYYRWHLIQDPFDFTDATGQPGPYVHDYEDPQGEVIGQFSLEITPATESNPIVTIESTGYTNQYPKVDRTIRAQYGRISLTRFAFLHNSNLWFSSDIEVNGPVFSNGGIRQDGTNTSTVESAKETYTCGVESGCTSPVEKPGVWGNGDDSSLWDFPVKPIDFDSIRVDFINMKTAAQNDGLYLGPSGAQGYHIVFVDDGTFTVYRVTGVSTVLGYSLDDGCKSLPQVIESEVEIGTYSVNDNQIIFVEDNAWVDGTVNGKTTVVAARFPVGTYETNIWVTDNLKYLDRNGDHRLGLIAEKDIILGIYVPDKFELNGAILAQNGRIIRHHYNYFGCRSGGQGVHSQKNEFNFFGSLISNQRSYWNYSSGPGSPASGFVKSTLDYDNNLFYDPPPYFPSSGTYEFLSWREIRN